MIRYFYILLASLAISINANAAAPVIKQSDKDKAASLVAKMTLEEKIDLIGGDVKNHFYTHGFPRLGIPVIRTADGPQGVRNKTKSTLYPSGQAIAASWSREAARMVGAGIGKDARARGVAILLGPGVNIYRSPLCGRNFEYYGEDPFLAGELSSEYIDAMQEQGVAATVKHFACNNSEYDRHRVGSNVDERTLNEIYFPAFRKAVEKAHVACVMTSYNPLNGTHAPENAWLIKENLRKWGFEGIAMTDWGSSYDPLLWAFSGIDLEMPDPIAFKPEYVLPMVRNGVIPEHELDEKCIHILSVYSAYGFLDGVKPDTSIPEDNPENDEVSFVVSAEAPVLLKNEGGILPLKPSKKKIVVIGPNADRIAFGGGSGAVNMPDGREVSLKDGMQKLGKGYNCVYLTEPDAKQLTEARAVIVAAGFWRKVEHEGDDRTYTLPEGQDELIAEVLKYNKNVIVVANSGGEFDVTKWIDKVPAFMLALYSGQRGGDAIAQLLAGKISPSGRLPYTFWGSLEKNPCTPYYAPIFKNLGPASHPRDGLSQCDYVEGIFLGYRGAEHFGTKPMFPFGYGLSYSKFNYSDLKVEEAGQGYDVSVKVTNAGKVAASEVVQVYVAPVNPSLPRPVRELKGFDKIKLAPGKSQTVTIHLDRNAFAHYDIYEHDWTVDSGKYIVQVCANAEEVILESQVEVGHGSTGYVVTRPEWFFDDDGPCHLGTLIGNIGDLKVVVTTDLSQQLPKKDTVFCQTVSVDGDHMLDVNLGKLEPGFYKVSVGKEQPFFIGVRPEEIVSPAVIKPDFDAFWESTIAGLADIPFDAELTPVPEHSDENRECFEVRIKSWGGGITGGILTIPRKPGKYPVWVNELGYGAKPEYANPASHPDRIDFHVSIRCQGLFVDKERGWMTRGLTSKEEYYYRGAFADVRRANDYVLSLDKADPDRLVVYSNSQGGALSFIAAALDPRVKAIAPGVPFLSDYRDYAKIAPWPMGKILKAAKEQGISEEALFDMLEYFDVKNFAHKVTCPVYMGWGMQDPTCPPHINFAIYNNLGTKDKRHLGVATCGHAIWKEAEWIKTRSEFLQAELDKIK